MRITHVETFIAGNPWKNWLFIRVHTDEGIYGVSEATINGFAKTVEAAIHELESMYQGMDPFQPERIVQRMYRDMYVDGGQIHKHAVAAIEIACWDIIGKSLGVPIYKLLGGQMRPRARAYANGWYRGPRPLKAFTRKPLAWCAGATPPSSSIRLARPTRSRTWTTRPWPWTLSRPCAMRSVPASTS